VGGGGDFNNIERTGTKNFSEKTSADRYKLFLENWKAVFLQ
jgi:hypothetical protein